MCVVMGIKQKALGVIFRVAKDALNVETKKLVIGDALVLII